MGLDLASQWMLSFFAACLAGLVVGWLVARFASFEVGLGVGLLLPGLVSLAFTARFVAEHHALTAGPGRAAGVVVAVEDRPASASGDVRTPVAVVEYESGATRLRVEGPGGALSVGDAVVVVASAWRPGRARFGVPGEAKGGAIASALFGSFPLSAAIFFLGGALAGERVPRRREPAASRLTAIANGAMLVALLAGGLVASGGYPVARAILAAFGGVSLGLWLHVGEGLRARRDPRWTLGMAVLAVNFTAWVVALWLLEAAFAGE